MCNGQALPQLDLEAFYLEAFKWRGVQWMWEAFVPEIGRSVFIVPAEAFKSKRPHVVILNDAAW